MDGRRGSVLAAWVMALLAEFFFARGACDGPTAWQVAVEALTLGTLGLVHARLGPPDWRGSPAWPGVLLLAAAVLRAPSRPALVALAWVGTPLFAVMLVRVLTDLTRRVPPWLTAVAATALFAVLSRFVVLASAPAVLPHLRLGEELGRPFSPATQREGPGGPPVVVVSIDTLRADHVATMQSWTRLAERGATWDRAMSAASWTVPALATLWTGLPPAEHGTGNRPEGGFSPISADTPLLTEQLVAAGYRTAAFVVNPFVATELGFRRGFATWSNPDEQVRHPLLLLGWPPGLSAHDGRRATDRALAWLADQPRESWLLWLHLFDPHLPYEHAPADSPSRTIDDLQAFREAGAGPELRAAVARDYRGEVAWADAQVGRLLDALEARAFFERGTLVLTADHGEELWDHGGFEHGHSHHGEVVDVGLVLVSPGVAPGPRPGVASLEDVASTLRAVAGLEARGLDLRQGVPEDRIATAAGNLYDAPQRSARSPAFRAIVTAAEGGEDAVLYDLAADPLELRPLPADAENPVVAAALQARTAAEGQSAAPVNTEALRALGYVE